MEIDLLPLLPSSGLLHRDLGCQCPQTSQGLEQSVQQMRPNETKSIRIASLIGKCAGAAYGHFNLKFLKERSLCSTF